MTILQLVATIQHRRRVRRRLGELAQRSQRRIERRASLLESRGERWSGHNVATCEYCRPPLNGKAW